MSTRNRQVRLNEEDKAPERLLVLSIRNVKILMMMMKVLLT